MLRLLLAFVLIVMVKGEGCCPPKAWEGYAITMAGLMKDGVPYSAKCFLTYHTNDTLGMIEMEGNITIDRWLTQKIRVIRDINKNLEYFIMDGRCSKKPMARKILECISENASLVLNTYLGAGPEKLAVKVYRFIDGNIEVYSTVTSSACIPVVEVTTGIHPTTNAEFMEVSQLSGITIGVKDPSVFDIPSICYSADISSDYVHIMSRWMPSGFY
ncbi:hypothetical protein ACJMK2_008068 [Sinanodonta woodiana]|uniref:Uncharacterized protein n=1 Tax=Sinanodonta woodiana TaxID=1069815 RepID=A0ABD3VMY7_SINWO